MTATAKAESTGHLGSTPLADVLISILDRALSGSLVVEEPTGQKSALTTREGSVTKAKTGARIDPTRSAAEQLYQQVEWLCARPAQSVYGFYRDVDFLHTTPEAELDPLQLIWRCSRQYHSRERVEQALQRIGARPLRLHRHASLDRFAFNWDDLTALEQLSLGPLTLAELLETPGCDTESLRAIVYVLALTRHLDLGDGRFPLGIVQPVSRTQPRSDVPSASSSGRPEPSSAQRSALKPSQPLLGPSSPPGSGRSTHPAVRAQTEIRLSSTALGRSIPPSQSTPFFSRRPPSRPASASLAPAGRSSSSGAPGGDSDDPTASAILNAEVLCRKGDFEQAATHARTAHLARPHDDLIGALYGYIQARRGRLKESAAETYLKHCAEALAKNPEDVHYRRYRAWVLLAAGRDLEAMREFKRIVRQDRYDIDAARQLRLYVMRQKAGSKGGPGSGGFFSFLRPSISPPSGSKPPKSGR